jgi:hypothetical protein
MSIETVKFIMNIFGCVLIWIAVDYKRTPECTFSIFSREGLVQLVLVTVALTIIAASYKS